MTQLETKNNQNWASAILKGFDASSFAEDAIQEYWYGENWFESDSCPVLFEISGDTYDWSLEFYVSGIKTEIDAKAFMVEKVTPEFIKFVSDNGVNRFWINFMEGGKKSQKLFEIFVSGNSKSFKVISSETTLTPDKPGV